MTLVLVLGVCGQRRDAFIVFVAALMIACSNGLKLLVNRERPDYFLITPGPSLPSFPSAHAVFATIFCGILIHLIGEWIASRVLRHALRGALGLMILVVGASRVYLGFHWPSNVVGDYLSGMVVLAELFWWRHRLNR